MEPTLTFIGNIHSELKSLEECPKQEDEDAPEASILIFPEFLEGIRDIKAGDELILLTWLHKSDRKVLKTRPRNNPEAPITGIFSTRSPNRSNPIGLHIVEVLSISEDGLIKVSGLEVIDQTPLIDMKPVRNK